MGRLFVVAWLACVGCASAGGGGADPDARPPGDASEDLTDAPPPVDAAIPVELVQTSSQAVVPTEIGCQLTDGSRITVENSYYRIFPLADHGVTSPLHITSVTFGIERATAGNGVSQQAQLRIGTYTGTVDATSFPVTALQQLASATIQIPNNATAPITTPISAFTPNAVTVQPGSVLYAELFIPNGEAAGNIFYIGSNNGAETHPSYIRAPECATSNPTTYAQVVGNPVIRILLSVSGTR